MPSNALPPARRIRRRGEFQRVFDAGRRVHGRHLTIIAAPGTGGESRLGIVASKKLGGAVVRNRAKTLIREMFRTNAQPARRPSDLVVIPKPSARTVSRRPRSSGLLRDAEAAVKIMTAKAPCRAHPAVSVDAVAVFRRRLPVPSLLLGLCDRSHRGPRRVEGLGPRGAPPVALPPTRAVRGRSRAPSPTVEPRTKNFSIDGKTRSHRGVALVPGSLRRPWPAARREPHRRDRPQGVRTHPVASSPRSASTSTCRGATCRAEGPDWLLFTDEQPTVLIEPERDRDRPALQRQFWSARKHICTCSPTRRAR